MIFPSEMRFLNPDGQLIQWPSKQTDQLLVLSYLAGKFMLGQRYSESEVNAILKSWHTFSDWPLLCRELFNRGFMDRNSDGNDYHLNIIKTDRIDLVLARPNVERDAPLAVVWLKGDKGRDTLRLMGNTDEQNKPSTLKEEQDRIREFIISTTQLTWMLMFKNKTIGTIWVDLNNSAYLKGPSVHIMVGNNSDRGQGIGSAAVTAVVQYLKEEDARSIMYSRYIASNIGSKTLFAKLGFVQDGSEYKDNDGLSYQNVVLKL